jgi:serine/threonine protein kinase
MSANNEPPTQQHPSSTEYNTTEVIFEHFRKQQLEQKHQLQQQQQQPAKNSSKAARARRHDHGHGGHSGDATGDDGSTSSTSTSASSSDSSDDDDDGDDDNEHALLHRMARDISAEDSSSNDAPQHRQQQQQQQQQQLVKSAKPKKVFSRATVERATAAKFAIAQHYDVLERLRVERAARASALERDLASLDDAAAEARRAALARQETDFIRLRRIKLRESSFDKLKRIGGGAFGEVWLVQLRGSTQVFAMKKMAKTAVVQRGKAEHIRAERDALAASSATLAASSSKGASPWVVQLFYSFQDRDHLYLVMEFVPGGDLMGLLMALDTFTESQARFYTAELLLAIEFVHSLNYIHRDVKPDNLLIDARGHLKISDFGLCTGLETMRRNALYERLREESTELQQNDTLRLGRRHQQETWRQRRRLMCKSAVGTPDYIAPEVFRSAGYGQECDWWSVGCILYEMLYGHPPFCAEQPEETFRNIMNWQQTLRFAPDVDVSPEAIDLIKGLLCDREQRLDLPAIKAHPFFASVDWDTLRSQTSFFRPRLQSPTDTRYYDEQAAMMDSEEQAQLQAGARADLSSVFSLALQPDAAAPSERAPERNWSVDLPFIGYTYRSFDGASLAFRGL